MNTNLFLPFDLAKKAKELGFDEPCFGKWNRVNKRFYPKKNLSELNKNSEFGINTVASPLYQQVKNWLHDTHNIYISNQISFIGGELIMYGIFEKKDGSFHLKGMYNLTENEAIGKAFELINETKP